MADGRDRTASVLFASAAAGEVGLWSWDSKTSQLVMQKKFMVFETSESGEKPDTVQCLSWNNSNTCLVAAPNNGKSLAHISIRNPSQYADISITHQLHKNSGKFTCSCYLSEDRQLLYGSLDNSITLCGQETEKTLIGHSAPPTCLCYSRKDNMVASGSQDGSILLHHITAFTNSPVQPSIILHKGNGEERVNCVKFSPYDSGVVASCGSSGSVKLWSSKSHRLLTSFSPAHSKEAYDLVFSPCNRMLLASVGADSTVVLYDTVQRKQLTQFNSVVPLCSILLTTESDLIGGGSDGKMYLYNLRSCKSPQLVVHGHTSDITALAIQRIPSVSPRSRKSRTKRSSQRPSGVGDDTISSASPALAGSVSSSSSSQMQTPLSSVTFRHPPPTTAFTTPAVSRDATGIFSPLGTIAEGKAMEPISVVPSINSEPAHNKTAPSSTSATTAVTTTHTSAVPVKSPVPLFTPAPQTRSGQKTVSFAYNTVTPYSLNQTDTSVGIFSPLDGVASTARQQPFPFPLFSDASKSVTTASPATTSTSLHPPPPPTTTSATITTTTSAPPPSLTATNAPPPSAPAPLISSSSSLVHNDASKASTESGNAVLVESSTVLREQPSRSAPEFSTLLSTGNATTLLATRPPPQVQSTPIPVDALQQTHLGKAVSQPPLSSSGAVPVLPHIQYLETMFRDQQDDILSGVHRHIRHLGVDMFRQFLITQEQTMTALTVINDKIEKMQNQIDRVETKVDHMMPKY